jgi:hypothetical protein
MGAWSPTWTGCRGAPPVLREVWAARQQSGPLQEAGEDHPKLRVTNGVLEGMNNKVKAISHRAFGFRTTWTYIANVYHCRAALPLPWHSWEGSPT